MLREDDLFKVVLNPGADKREKRILGQIIRMFRKTGTDDTGGASVNAFRLRDRSKNVAQLL
jgi:hypothetical protein